MAARIEYQISLDDLKKVHGRIEQRRLELTDYVLFGHFVGNLISREEAKVDRLAAKIAAEHAAAAAAAAHANQSTKIIDVEFKPIADGPMGAALPEPKPGPTDVPKDPPPAPDNGTPDKRKAKGHGRNGAAAFTNASHSFYTLMAGIIGSLCARCGEARMTLHRELVRIRIVGQPMFGAQCHHAEQARCKACGRVVSAEIPQNILMGIGKAVIYDWSACAMLIVLHYFYGLPFKRIEILHKSWGIPLADANQWQVSCASVALVDPMLDALVRFAIKNMTSFLMDDTGSIILTLKRQISDELKIAKALGIPEDSVRTGINASGFYITTPFGIIVLYFTGRHHAGEILRELLKHRLSGSPKVNKVTDGASKNFLGPEFADLLEDAVCNVHAFLKFYDIKAQFPAEYKVVGAAYDKIYETEQIAKERKMSDDERLAFHQEKSRSEMERIKAMCEEKVTSRLFDPRSQLYEAIHFFLNQWPKLTKFLEIAGMPLDTNICEQSLIAPVRYLAASFNYHTVKGAEVGDHAMSLVATARANGIEAVAWTTHCLEHHVDLAQNPENYFPWAYKERIAVQQRPTEKPPDPIH